MTSLARDTAELPDKPVAVLLPGVGYTAQAPLLYWCAALLAERGWHVQTVAWTVDAEAHTHPLPFVERAVAEAFDASPPSTRRLIVAKSFGTWALPWARRNGIAGVWLTPLLTEEPVRRSLLEAADTDIAIGGDEDAFWRPELVAGTKARVISVPGASHTLTMREDWSGSMALQARILADIASHIDSH